MDNLKEQIKELIMNNFSPKCLDTDCNNFLDPIPEVCAQCTSEQIHSLYEQAGYLPIQAGEDGLVDDETRYIIEINTYKEFYPNQQFMGMHKAVEYKLYENLLKAQKALTESQAKQKQADIVVACDMLITELISYKDGKLTFKDIEPSLQRWNQYRIEAFKKQTLEEI
jgi:hypothetical protein